MKVSVLAENTVYKKEFLGEHGLSLFLETEVQKNYLFDMGQTGVFLQNAEKLSVDLKNLDGVILSHGHYDHCDGMKEWSESKQISEELRSEIPVYLNQKTLDRKYSKHPKNGEVYYNGIREDAVCWMQERANVVCLKEPCTEISENVYLLSEVPYVTEFETPPERFWKKISGQLELARDRMEDEQLLVVRENQGLCVFAGCAHPGIINCLNHVQRFFPGEHIHSLVAGMHLKGCSQKRLQATIQALQELELDLVVPLHCTGILEIAAIKKALGEKCVLAEVGKKIIL
ncbi:MAG: MBL fold metallo-hydrolase [Lachnospiraceae bacterium]|nr:MBL fold metallo-hydrolase [Lachnospiraceae bacterium]